MEALGLGEDDEPSRSKQSRVDLLRTHLQSAVLEIEDVWVLDPEFHDGAATRFEDRFGRRNMVIEGPWYLKWKGNWGQSG